MTSAAGRRSRGLLDASAVVINLPFVNSKLDFLTAGSSPCSHGAPEIPTPVVRGGLRALRRARSCSRSSASSSARALYRNGLDADGTDPARAARPFAKVLANAYYLDVGLARFVSGPGHVGFARFLNDGIDRDVIDGAVNGVGHAFRSAGGGLRKVQTGLVRNYALAIVLGAVLLVVFVTTRATL